MIENNTSLKKRKKERIKVTNLSEFNNLLKAEGYNISNISYENFNIQISKIFNITEGEVFRIYNDLSEGKITYVANNIYGFIDYIKKIIVFENEHNKLCKKINNIKKLYIDRVEFERIIESQDDVESILKIIKETKKNVASMISENEKLRLDILEKEIEEKYLYSKDIELLKKMVIGKNNCIIEGYDYKTQIKRISIEIPNKIDYSYIPVKKGSMEYYQHISTNIPRLKRLIKNIDSYIEMDKKDKYSFKINQSSALQDSINIAVATYNDKEFKAISGKNNIKGYCKVVSGDKAFFKSSKVNKLGKLGIGYNRVNDSEKKILEEIHNQIELGNLDDNGSLILYSRWEPCPSCYYVIRQFCEKYPNVEVKVKYAKIYGNKGTH